MCYTCSAAVEITRVSKLHAIVYMCRLDSLTQSYVSGPVSGAFTESAGWSTLLALCFLKLQVLRENFDKIVYAIDA